MKCPRLSALVLGVLAGAGLAACSSSIKPNTVTFPGNHAATAGTEATAAASTSAPAETSAPPASSASAAASAATETPPASSSETSAAPAASVLPASAAAPVSMPTRGMLMSTVAREFGEPLEKLPAVPDPGTKVHPPITRWIYPEYVVYFEYNYVVHSVLKAHPFANPGAGTH